jgi:hypothetical protein
MCTGQAVMGGDRMLCHYSVGDGRVVRVSVVGCLQKGMTSPEPFGRLSYDEAVNLQEPHTLRRTTMYT